MRLRVLVLAVTCLVAFGCGGGGGTGGGSGGSGGSGGGSSGGGSGGATGGGTGGTGGTGGGATGGGTGGATGGGTGGTGGGSGGAAGGGTGGTGGGATGGGTGGTGGGATGGGTGGTGGGATGGGTGGTGGGATGGGTGGTGGGATGGGTGGGSISPDAGPGALLAASSFYGHLKGVTFANGKFVAVGENGVTAQSTDGLSWQFFFAPTAETLSGITWQASKSQYIATGWDGGVYTSPNAQQWTARPSGANFPLVDVAAGPNLIVAVGARKVIYSSDGLNWDAGTWPNAGQEAVSVAYHPGQQQFAALGVASGGASNVYPTTTGGTFGAAIAGFGSQRYLQIRPMSTGYVLAGFQRIAYAPTGGVVYQAGGEFRGVAVNDGIAAAVGRWGGLALTFDSGTFTDFSEHIATGTLNGAAYGNGVYVAVGEDGTLLRSTNATTWTTVAEGTETTYNSVAYGNGRYVAMGGRIADVPRSLTSTDGVNWSFGPRVASYVKFVDNGFVALGESGKVSLSNDGLSWQTASSPNFYGFIDSARSPSRIVAIGSFTELATSLDGGSWTKGDAGLGIGPAILNVVYAQNQFVAVGSNGTVLTSPDGLVWTKRALPGTPFESLLSVNFVNNEWLITGRSQVFTSPDAVTWTATPVPQFNLDGYALHDGTQFVCSRAQSWLVTSPDGLTWTPRDGGLEYNNGGYNLQRGVHNAGTYAFGYQPNRIATTTNLDDFRFFNSQPNANISGFVDRGAAGLLAVNELGLGYESSDRASFSHRSLPTETGIRGRAAKNGNTIVGAVGKSNVLTSTDNGATWTRIRLGPVQAKITAVVYAFGQFRAFGEQGTYTSTDGLTWTTNAPLVAADSLVFANNRLVLQASGSLVYTDNGTNWMQGAVPADGGMEKLHDVNYGNGVWVAVGDKGTVYASTDGIAWQNRSLAGVTDGFQTVQSVPGGWVAAGSNGLLATSLDGGSWTRKQGPAVNLISSAPGNGNDVWIGGAKGLLLKTTP